MKITENIIERVLRNDANPEEARLVADWFATEEGQAYLRERIGADGDVEDLSYVDDELIQRVYQDMMDQIKRAKRRRIITLAAACLIPAMIMLGYIGVTLPRSGWFDDVQYSQITVAKGEQATITLHDGTVVALNSETTFKYPTSFGRKQRNVYLDGQAYFSVDSDPSRPFVVNLSEAKVVVTGTKFDVEAYKSMNSIVVSLDEGAVRFDNNDNSYDLKPHQQITFNKQDCTVEIVDFDNTESAEWRYNILTFNRVGLESILSKISRQYNVEFNVKNTDVYKYNYTLKSEDMKLDDLLDRISKLSPVSFTTNGDIIEVDLR